MKDTEPLFEGWLSGDLSEEEIDRLLGRIAEGEEDSPWPSMIRRLLHDPSFAGMGDPDQRDRLFQQVMERGRLMKQELDFVTHSSQAALTGNRTRARTRVRILGWAVAASLLLLLAGGIWWFKAFRTDQGAPSGTVPIAKTDLLPGTNKAILTLGDGSAIVLDSSAKGQLAVQPGSIVVKSGNGQIVYQGTGKPGAGAHSGPDGDGKDAAGQVLAQYNTLSTPRGGQYKLALSDGTLVWLNAASSITYPTAFTGKERRVKITGEAYFEVARNNAAPFHVQVKDMDVQVLGTHFNINAYEDEASINTTLLEGAVRVANGDRQALLQPGQQARLPRDGSLGVISRVNEEEVLAWKNGYFSFHHTDLQTVMRELARWYDVEIEYRGKVPDMKFGGDIPRSANASQVLHILEESRIHFVIEGKKIIVTP